MKSLCVVVLVSLAAGCARSGGLAPPGDVTVQIVGEVVNPAGEPVVPDRIIAIRGADAASRRFRRPFLCPVGAWLRG